MADLRTPELDLDEEELWEEEEEGEEEGEEDEDDGDRDDAGDSSDGADDIEAMRKALKKANKEAETYRLKVKEFEDASKSEQEKLTESLQETERKAATAELNALRYEVALDKGIPKSIASRLQGSTRKELETDAESLMEELGTKKKRPSFDAGAKDKDAPGSGSFLSEALRSKRGA